jgi:Domain of unknown function (DUF4259)
MGAWGPAVFSDDTACDIRSDYRELLEDGVEDAEATRRVVAEYQHLDADEAHVLWLALAAVQASLGRLDLNTKEQALRIIDDGVGLGLWLEAGPKELARRKAALAKLRDTLTGPQKAPVKVRKPWSHSTDLSPGDVLSYDLPDGTQALFRVARLDEHRVGTAPILRRLDWTKTSLPSARKMGRLKPVREPHAHSGPGDSFRVARHRKKDEDWDDAGFALVGRVAPATEDATYPAHIYTTWRGLRTTLDRGLRA